MGVVAGSHRHSDLGINTGGGPKVAVIDKFHYNTKVNLAVDLLLIQIPVGYHLQNLMVQGIQKELL